MSKLDALNIVNIRSFGVGGGAGTGKGADRRGETIKFYTPLTLVVGLNGSGKTTIIECLKYGFTGLQPPNSKIGGAFVHDPKLGSHHNEVLAQVRLKFEAANGSTMVLTRSLQLTVKKLTRSLKTLEGNLMIDNKKGERTSVSSRVAELDMILPQYLGVSTAVIDNVIFCHQDESLWPMSDSSTLKKKFDEIFEAQKYTKAIANIKDIRKKHNEELGKYKIMEQHAKEDRDKAEKSEKKAHELQKDIERLRRQIEDLNQSITHARDLAASTWQEAESYAKILGQLEGKRIEADGKRRTIQDLKTHLKEVDETDAWLESTLAQFESRQRELEKDLESKQKQYVSNQDETKTARAQLNNKLAEMGKHEQEKQEYDRQIARRQNLVREAATKHQLRGYEDLSDDRGVEEFIFKIKRISKEQTSALERAKRDHDMEKREGQSIVNKLAQDRQRLQDKKSSAKKQMSNNDHEASGFQAKADEIQVDEGSKAVIESRMESLEAQMRKAQEYAIKADWERKLNEANADLRKQEEESNRLNAELVQSTKTAGEMARLIHIKQELKERQHSLQTLISAHGERINILLGETWTSENLEKVYQTHLDEATSELSKLERSRDALTREMEQVQFKQKTIKDDISRKTTEADKYEREVRQAIDGEPSDYEETLESAKSSVEFARSETRGFEGLQDYISKVLKALEAPTPACRTCERAFKSHNDPLLAKTKNRMEKLLKQASSGPEQSNLQEAEQWYDQVSGANLSYENWKKLVQVGIPTADSDLESLGKQRLAILSRLDNADKGVEDRLQSKKEIESIARTVGSIVRCVSDIKNLNAQIEEFTAKSSQQSNSVRTLEDIQNDLVSVTEQAREVRKMVQHLTTEQDQSKAEIASMQLRSRDLQSEISNIGFELEKKTTFLGRVKEFRLMNQKLREEQELADREIDTLNPEISAANARLEDIVERTHSKEREMSQELSELMNSVSSLDLLDEQINAYLGRGGLDESKKTKKEVEKIEDQIASIETTQANLSREMNKMNELVRDGNTTKRQYSDNLRYRQETRSLHQLEQEIEELTAHNAEVDRDRLQVESDKYTREYNQLSAKQAGLMGEMSAKDDQLGELKVNFETDFIDAPKRYKEAHIKVETTKAAVEDLGRYGGALDKAIMKYHSLKMEEINNIIDELWRRTYKGTDVDTIMIRADNESARGNRSYNYRVVMIKRDAEMDMRGRCSAGQKVLASIIIRLALAECFSQNCGIIALDEPTTNLDRDNVQSLAEALHDIIKARQQQSNFQLIVITHDEDFLRAMKCGDFADYYWRVDRDAEANSYIERQEILKVIGR